jgi:hypothetical protein
MGLVALVLGLAGVALSAAAIAACLGLRSPVSFALAWFLVAWGLVVVLTLALSVFSAWTVTWTLVAIGLATVGSVAVWQRRGRPAAPPAGPAGRAVAAELRDPALAMLAGAVVLGWAYLAVVGVVIPPMDWDVLMYHLPRIVLWMQQGGVGAIPNAGTSIVAHPPGAEIAQGTTMLLSGGDRWVWVIQWIAGGATALGVAGIARRIGVERRGALFAALVFLTFPIVVVQGATAYNDVVVAAALVAAVYFALGGTSAELALAAVAVALALTTKISGILALPALVLFVLVAAPRERLARIFLVGGAGCAAGCGWYLWNLARTGSWDGGLADEFDQTPSRAVLDVLLRAEGYAVSSLDLSGVVGSDRWLFPLAGIALTAVCAVLARRGRAWIGLAVAALAVAVTPWAIDVAHDVAVRAFARGWIAIGKRDVIGFLPGSVETRASPPEAWFGPALVPLGLAAMLLVLLRGGRTTSRALVLTACLGVPLVLLATNSFAFAWQEQRGRFFVFAAAIAAAGFGVLERSATARWAGATVSVLTLGLTIVHYSARPLGVELLEPRTEPTLWTAPRWEAQSAYSRDAPEVGEALRRVADEIPIDATIALARVVQAPYYPLLGPGPWRQAVFVPPDGHIPREASWVAIPIGGHADVPPTEWRLLPGTGTGDAWTIYRRVG